MTSRVRGPLRALHGNAPSMGQCSTPTDTDSSISEDFRILPEEVSVTPVLRMTLNDDHLPSLPYAFPAPLRTSSCRGDKHAVSATTEDIRSHFPIRSGNGMKNHMQFYQSPPKIGQKRASDTGNESSTESKWTRLIDSQSAGLLTMGAYVKEHPRYARRSSDQINPISATHQVQPINRLSPVCPVPMPQGFPSTVGLPWELRTNIKHRQSQVTQRTVETQTSPLTVSNMQQNRTNSTKTKRQSFGSTQVIRQGLRQTFGQLRRAFSAERLHRTVQTRNNSHCESPGKSKLTMNAFTHRGSSFRLSRSRRSTSCHRSPGKKIVETNNVKQCQNATPVPQLQPSAPLSRLPDLTEYSRLTYHVLEKYIDGSFRVVLRRASVNEQFGFFIARDAQGIYISRLGSVRCTAKFWDMFHVGDRLLEVQGVQCAQLDIEDVQNLIRKCELAEFRIRPASCTAVTSTCLR